MSSPLPLVKLHHVSRVTTRLEQAIAFYRDVLGFAEIPRPNFDFRGAWLFNYGLQIHLIDKSTGSAAEDVINSRSNHIAFATDDLSEVEQALKAHGIEYKENFQARNPNVRQLFFQDPDGFHIEVGNYPA
jgi:catechol 2,3-dioxygenase-like lactoylglutathione lyase family enzyme